MKQRTIVKYRKMQLLYAVNQMAIHPKEREEIASSIEEKRKRQPNNFPTFLIPFSN